jgi:hypothetical protein
MQPFHRPPLPVSLCLTATVAAVVLWGGPASAQVVEPRDPVERTELGGRVHVQLNTTSGDDGPASELLVRRARIWTATRINDWIDGAVQVDVSGASAVARFAFVRLSLSSAARLSFGQFKRAFDSFELTSSSQILVVERDGDVRGAGDCTGVGGVCSYSRFSEKLLFSSLDVGVLLQGEVAGGRLGYLLSATNGPGPNTGEENDAKSFSGRAEWTIGGVVKLGANGAVHDYSDPVTAADRFARAVALDVEVGDFDGGLHLQAGVMLGDNWRNLDEMGDESRFLTWQGIATYRISLDDTARVRAIEPLARVSWGDPDRDTTSDAGLLFTPGVMVHFQGRNKIALNVDVWRPQQGLTNWGLKAQSYLYF